MRLARYIKNPRYVYQRLLDIRRPRTPSYRQVRYLGMNLLTLQNEAVGWRIAHDDFERAELVALARWIRPGDVCVDVGGNIGVYTVWMGNHGAGEVHAFEPIAQYRSIIHLNCLLNGVANLKLHPGVASDQDGELEVSVAADGALSSLRATGRVPEVSRVAVPSWRLDSVFPESPIHVLKVDVEGAELLVLRGAEAILASDRRPRVALVELNPVNEAAYGVKPEDVVEYLRGFGYLPHSILKKRVEPTWPVKDGAEDVLFVHTDA